MEHLSSEWIKSTPSSFIRSILKATADPEIILSAGGLPNPVSLPQEELLVSMERIVRDYRSSLFQYSITAGFPELRQYIADHYNRKFGFTLGIENVLITTGSWQALDLILKALLNIRDDVIVEKLGHLGAIQTFSQCQPVFCPAEPTREGMNIGRLKDALAHDVESIYAIPDSQNPMGLDYSTENRECTRKVLTGHEVVLVEDDPYGELRFDEGGRVPYIGAGRLSDNVLLGAFPKIVAPGMRANLTIYADTELLKHISMTREASDLHTNVFSQYLIWDYLMHNDYDAHIPQIRRLYKKQMQVVTEAVDQYFPKIVEYIRPRGGMSLWAILSEDVGALSLFPKALEKGVAFVPGDPFYINMANTNTMRLNYTDADCRTIDEEIRRLGELLKEI